MRYGRAANEHGLGRSPEYRIWAQMIQRCNNPKDRGYRNWGGRGIAVCDRWRASFRNFIADMGPRPEGLSSGGRALYSIDRINNDGHYEPGNCRWATQKEQCANTRRALRERCPVVATARSAGLTEQAIRYRIKQGMSLEEALTKPKDTRGRPRKAA